MAQSDAQGSEQERFLSAVYLGSDLLGKGDLDGARAALEEALSVRPDDAKARNLLGLTCFKLGAYEEAESIYRKLIHENPADATLRVNLGLVYLKAGRYEEAIAELSTAADLEPGHKRAQNYLGLAHARVGDYAQARECFAAAGSTAMVAEMEKALAGEDEAPVLSKEEGASEAAESSFEAEVDVDGEEDDDEELVVEIGDEADEEGAAPAEAEAREGADAPAPAPEPAPAPSPVTPSPAPAALARLPRGGAEASPLHLGRDEPRIAPSGGDTFEVGDGYLMIPVRGEVLCRCGRLVASSGALDFTAEVKRFRGRATDKPFGEGGERFFRVSGEGQLILGLGDRVVTCFSLDDVDGYFEESSVLAFQESVAYENGRVPSSVSPDLNLVHLRGQGQIAVRSAGAIRAMDVVAGTPFRIPLDHLVGWQGALTPRIAVLADEGGPEGEPLVGVELTGEGVVLVSLPPAGRP